MIKLIILGMLLGILLFSKKKRKKGTIIRAERIEISSPTKFYNYHIDYPNTTTRSFFTNTELPIGTLVELNKRTGLLDPNVFIEETGDAMPIGIVKSCNCEGGLCEVTI